MHSITTARVSEETTALLPPAALLGLGIGAKDYRLVFVFHNQQALNRFVDDGWAFGGQMDAAAKADEKGDAIGGEITVDNITIYQLTETGLALQATIKGTKFWRDDALN